MNPRETYNEFEGSDKFLITRIPGKVNKQISSKVLNQILNN